MGLSPRLGSAGLDLCSIVPAAFTGARETIRAAQVLDGPRKRAGSRGAQGPGGWPRLHWDRLGSGTRDRLLQGAHSLTGKVQLRLLAIMAEKAFLLAKISSLCCGLGGPCFRS